MLLTACCDKRKYEKTIKLTHRFYLMKIQLMYIQDRNTMSLYPIRNIKCFINETKI